MSAVSLEQRPYCYQFGSFELRPRMGLLYLRGEVVPLAPKAVEVLLLLVEKAGEVVGKQELIDRVWADAFVGESSITKNISILRKLLREEFGEVEVIRSLSKRGYQLTVPVSVRTEEQAVDPGRALPAVHQELSPRLEPRRAWTRATALAALALVCVVGWMLSREWGSAGATPPKRRSIAVLDLKDLSNTPGEEWLGTGLAEMLRAELLEGGGVQTVSGERVANMRSELRLGPAAGYEPDALRRIRVNLGCDLVVTGTYAAVGDRVRVDLRIDNPDTGEVSAVFSETSPRQNVFELVTHASGAVRKALGISVAPRVSADAMAEAQVEIPQRAMQPYSEGIARLRQGDAQGAQKLLSEAVQAEPGYAPAHAALASAWQSLGFDGRAREEAKQALDASGPLPREQKLQVEGQYFETVADWPKAIETYSALWRFYPDQLDYPRKLADAQVSGNRAKDALETLRKVRAANPAAARDSRLLLAEAGAHQSLSDFPQEVRAADEAVQSAHAAGASLMEGRSLLKRGHGYTRLGENGKAAADFQAAQEISAGLGDSAGVSSALLSQGQLQQARNDAAAEATLSRALEIERQIGYRRAAAHTLQSLAGIHRGRADMKGARDLLQQALALFVELGDGPGEVMAHVNLGNIANNTGDAAGARREYAVGLDRAHQIDDRRGASIATGNIAVLDFADGDLPRARAGFEQALELKRRVGDKENIAYTLGWLSDVAIASGDFAKARILADEQGALLRSAGLASLRDQIVYARLAIEEGRPADAEKPMADLAAQSALPNPGASAYRLLAESRLAQGDLKKAREAADAAVQLAGKSPNLTDYGIPAGLIAARLDAAQGQTTKAVASMRKLLESARKLKHYPLQLEIRLYLAEAEKRPRDLADVRRDAEAHGFRLIARKAEQAGRAGL